MKKLIINITMLILICLCSELNAQTWLPCNLATTGNSTGGTAVCVHNNKLFASNNVIGLNVSSDNGATWTVVNSTIIANGFGVDLYSTSDRLYAILHNSGCIQIQYSTDDGLTFQLDTAGLPKCYAGAVTNPDNGSSNNGTIAWNNHLMMSLAGPDWEFSRNTSNPKWDDANYFDANDCSEFFVKNDTCWAATNGATSNGVAWSIDGLNWTSPVSAGIPNFYVPTQIAWCNNRLLMMGSDVGAGNAGIDTVLKYSDDFGATFLTNNIKNYLEPYAFFSASGKQPTRNMYVGYGSLFLTLGQDVLGTAPELIVSTDKGNTFSKDTIGFIGAANTNLEIKEMAFLNGWAFAQVNSGDLYRKQIATVGIEETININNSVSIYPNPSNNFVVVSSKETITKYDIYNSVGQIVVAGNYRGQTIDISALETGLYIIHFVTNDNKQILKEIIKN
jgi:hypothetical protein